MPPNPYESEKILSEYLLFHYGESEVILGGTRGPAEAVGFAVRCVTHLLDVSRPLTAALDVGCAVGRSSFELARLCDRVLGVDFSQGFIRAALTLQSQGALATHCLVEGTRTMEFTAFVPPAIEREHVHFETGDAMALREDIGSFDVVLAANLICRLPEPARFLDRLPHLVNSGGQLLLTTPFTWLEEFTPRENWVGGNAGIKSFDALGETLSPHFELQHTCDLPFLIREHARKFQYGVALGSRWIRR